MKQYDAIIIGFGKGGKLLAAELANRNWKVAIIERSPQMYGGTCVNVGCIPTKALIYESEQAERLYRQAWAIRRERLGGQSPTSLRAESGLGALLMRQARMDEAGALLVTRPDTRSNRNASCPALISCTSPGTITDPVPIESLCSSAPSRT